MIPSGTAVAVHTIIISKTAVLHLHNFEFKKVFLVFLNNKVIDIRIV
jgi:hypothetical protein